MIARLISLLFLLLVTLTGIASAQPKQIARLDQFNDTITSVCWNQDGTLLAAGSYEKVVLWSVSEQKVIRSLTDVNGYASSLCFHPDQKRLYVGGYQQTLTFDIKTGNELEEWKGHRGQITGLALAAKDKLCSCSDDGTVLLRTANGEELQEWETDDPINSLAISKDQKRLALAIGDETRVTRAGQVVLIDLEKWRAVSEWELHKSAVTDVLFAQTGQLLLSSSFDETVIITDTKTEKPVSIFKQHARPVNCLALIPKTDSIISGSGGRYKKKNELKIWNRVTGEVRLNVEPHEGKITVTAVSSDGKFLATGGADEVAIIWDLSELSTEN